MKQLTSRRVLLPIAALVVVVAGTVGVRTAWPRITAGPAASPVPPPAIAAVVPIRRRTLAKTATIVAELRPWNVIDVYAKQSGYLRDIYVDYGSRVSAGETIAVLDLPEQQAAYDQAEAAYKLAQIDYARILSVVHAEPGLIAAEDVDKAQAQYLEAKDERDQDAVLLGYADIVAPFSGVVTKRFADPGALIQAGTSNGTEPIVRIADNYTLRLVIEVPEDMVERIAVGTPVGVTITDTGEHIGGTVARYSYDVHEETRTMHTEVDLTNPDLRLKPGMYASVTLTVARRNGVLAVPTQAVALSGQNSTIWIVDRHDRVEQRTVTTGLQTPNWTQIVGGVKPGELVFIGDRSQIALGTKVEPKIVPILKA